MLNRSQGAYPVQPFDSLKYFFSMDTRKILTNDQVSKIIDFAEAHPEIAAIYLFGSFAAGRQRSKSDIDLGVLFFADVSGFARVDMETELSNLLSGDVDLIDMGKSSPVLRHQIYKHGKLLYQSEKDFPFQFRANSIRDYLDTAFIRRERRKSLYG